MDEQVRKMAEQDSKSPLPSSEFGQRFVRILEAAMKLKKVMLKKNLKVAKAKCPFCETGYLWGKLYSQRRDPSGYHLHMSCDGTCNVAFME